MPLRAPFARSPMLFASGLLITWTAAFGQGAETRPADANEASSALLAHLAEAQRPITSAQGVLTWRTRRTDEAASAARVQQVQFFLEFPAHYCVVFTKPGDDEWKHSFLSDGVQRWEIQRQFKDEPADVKVSPADQDDADFRRMLACFRMDLPELRKDFALEAAQVSDGGASLTRVSLTPLRPAIAEQVTSVVLAIGRDDHLIRLSWDDPQGNHYEASVDQAAYNQPIDPGLFRWSAPRDK